jgi:hypothetical protein
MKLPIWMVLAAVLYAGFGVGLLLIPSPFMAMYGVNLNVGGEMMARILGSALIGFALTFYWMRNDSRHALMSVLRASFVYNVVDFFVVLTATLGGVMNAMGWMPVGLHVFLALGFGYFAFVKK